MRHQSMYKRTTFTRFCILGMLAAATGCAGLAHAPAATIAAPCAPTTKAYQPYTLDSQSSVAERWTALIAFVRERTPERAAVPVALHFIDNMPQTAVGKIFKPALRVDAIERVARGLLADVALDGAALQVAVQPHATLGQVIAVQVRGAAAPAQAAVAQAISARLNPLTVQHTIAFN